MFHKRPALILSDYGIADYVDTYSHIPWEDISTIDVTEKALRIYLKADIDHLNNIEEARRSVIDKIVDRGYPITILEDVISIKAQKAFDKIKQFTQQRNQ